MRSHTSSNNMTFDGFIGKNSSYANTHLIIDSYGQYDPLISKCMITRDSGACVKYAVGVTLSIPKLLSIIQIALRDRKYCIMNHPYYTTDHWSFEKTERKKERSVILFLNIENKNNYSIVKNEIKIIHLIIVSLNDCFFYYYYIWFILFYSCFVLFSFVHSFLSFYIIISYHPIFTHTNIILFKGISLIYLIIFLSYFIFCLFCFLSI